MGGSQLYPKADVLGRQAACSLNFKSGLCWKSGRVGSKCCEGCSDIRMWSWLAVDVRGKRGKGGPFVWAEGS